MQQVKSIRLMSFQLRQRILSSHTASSSGRQVCHSSYAKVSLYQPPKRLNSGVVANAVKVG